MKFLEFLALLCVITAINKINCETTQQNEPQFIGHLYGQGQLTTGFINVMSNISFNCTAEFNCKVLEGFGLSCDDLSEIQWFVPRQLREHQLMFGHNSNRMTITEQRVWAKDKNQSTRIIYSQLNISSIGTIHNGNYTCKHELIQYTQVFEALVTGMLNILLHNYAECVY